MKTLLTLLGITAAAYAMLIAALWWGQERIIFLPSALPAEHRFAFGADVHERWVEVPGARLSALHLKLPAPKGLVFYLHGNAGNLEGWFTGADFWRRMNLDVFMLDYRGYGKSSGRIESQAQLQADVRAAFASVAPAYAGKRIVLFGRSLGTGLAADLAAELSSAGTTGAQPDLVALVSPYTSFRELAREHYPIVPAAVLRYPMASDQWLPRITAPLWIAHGEMDNVIPPAHGQRLAKLARQATLVLVPGAGHNDIHEFPAYLGGLKAALDRL